MNGLRIISLTPSQMVKLYVSSKCRFFIYEYKCSPQPLGYITLVPRAFFILPNTPGSTSSTIFLCVYIFHQFYFNVFYMKQRFSCHGFC